MLSKIKNVKGFTLIELMVVVAIIGIILAIAIPYFIGYKRSTCDKAAAADVAKLGASMQRFGQELIDMNCQLEMSNLGDQINMAWVVGPYYGFSGTNEKCETMIAVANTSAAGDSWEMWGCAVKGSHPSSDGLVRWVYRQPLMGGKDKQAVWGLCNTTGIAPSIHADSPVQLTTVTAATVSGTYEKYGTNCYTASMISVDTAAGTCSVKEPPGGSKLCAELVAAD